MMEPISPRSAMARTLGMRENTYNLLIGGPQTIDTVRSGNCAAEQIGSASSETIQETSTNQGETDPASLGLISTSPGIFYYPKRILAEGWLQKKGSGEDWMGSRGWKARWGRLCMVQVVDEKSAMNKHWDLQKQAEQMIQVPLLLLYWFPTSTNVSTAIVLDSTVVLPIDLEDNSRWNPFRFEIQHATSQENTTLPTKRTFAAPQTERDAWVYAISQALLTFAKEKDQARKIVRQQPRFFRPQPNPRWQRQGAQGMSNGRDSTGEIATQRSLQSSSVQRPLSPFRDDERPLPLAPLPKLSVTTPFSQAV